jgi:hypothetical protein
LHVKTVLVLGIAASAMSCGAKIDRQATESKDFVEGIVAKSLSEVSAQIRDGALGDKVGTSPATVRLPAPPNSYIYGMPSMTLKYRIFSIAGPWDGSNLRMASKEDPAMDRYLRLPPEARKNDIFLANATIGSYWHSEYVSRGEPLPFYCSFVLHLQEDGPTQTKVEVLEYNPRVASGKHFVVGHGTIGFVADAVLVPPTTRDRVEMLHRIQMLSTK